MIRAIIELLEELPHFAAQDQAAPTMVIAWRQYMDTFQSGRSGHIDKPTQLLQ